MDEQSSLMKPSQWPHEKTEDSVVVEADMAVVEDEEEAVGLEEVEEEEVVTEAMTAEEEIGKQICISNKKRPFRSLFCVLVAGPGGAPGLEDYAFLLFSHSWECRTISSPHCIVRVWRIVSTDSLRLIGGCLGIARSGFHRYSQIFIRYLHIDGPILSLLCYSTLPRDSSKEQPYYSSMLVKRQLIDKVYI